MFLHVIVQSLSLVWLFVTPWTVAHQASLFSMLSQSLLKSTFIELVMLSNHLILCYSLLLLPSVFSIIRVFSNVFALCITWPKYWSFSFSTSPSNGYSGLISFRIDWFDLLVVQGILKSLLQYHSSKTAILCHSTFFMIQLLYSYMTTEKIIALIIYSFVSKWRLCFLNMLSRFLKTFIPRRKCLLISWLQSPSTVTLGPKKIQSVIASTFPPSICHEVRTRCHNISFPVFFFLIYLL